uniref:EO2-4 n=1 Tax=Carp adomavirus TaxID=2609874 RepID=A0A6F9F1X7_9VIRU|nr:TPA_asm: EO2-4 [Carp adomavirus]
MEIPKDYFEADLRYAGYFNRKRKRRAKQKQLRNYQLWLDYMMPFLFSYHLSYSFVHDTQMRESFFRPKRALLSNYNMFFSAFPNDILDLAFSSGHIWLYEPNPLFARISVPRCREVASPQSCIYGWGEVFEKHLYYQRSSFVSEKLPYDYIWLVFCQDLFCEQGIEKRAMRRCTREIEDLLLVGSSFEDLAEATIPQPSNVTRVSEALARQRARVHAAQLTEFDEHMSFTMLVGDVTDNVLDDPDIHAEDFMQTLGGSRWRFTYAGNSDVEYSNEGSRTFVFNSNLIDARTGVRSMPSEFHQFEFHLAFKAPTSVCIGPVFKRVKKRFDVDPTTVTREQFCEQPYIQKEMLEYVPRELVFRVDLSLTRRLCCGRNRRMCRQCLCLLSAYASWVSTIVHELFLVDRIVAMYDGECSVFVICFDYSLFRCSRHERRQMATLVRAVLCSCGSTKLIPKTLRGLVKRITRMMQDELRGTRYTDNLLDITTPNSISLNKLRTLCGLTNLGPIFTASLVRLARSGLTIYQALDILYSCLDKADNLALDDSVSQLDTFMREVFKPNCVCLDELDLTQYMFPAPYSPNPYTNNLCMLLQCVCLPGYTLEGQALPVIFNNTQLNMSAVEAPLSFPSFLSKNMTQNYMVEMYRSVHNLIMQQNRRYTYDISLHHLKYHYTKYDRLQCFQRMAGVVTGILSYLAIFPHSATFFVSAFRQFSPNTHIPDTTADKRLAAVVLEFLKSFFHSESPRPLRISARYLRAIVLTSPVLQLVATAIDIQPSVAVHGMMYNEGLVIPLSTTARMYHPDLIKSFIPKMGDTTTALGSIFRARVSTYMNCNFPDKISRFFTKQHKDIAAQGNFHGWHEHNSVIGQTLNNMLSQGAMPRQGPMGFSSGEELSTTSDSVSEYYDTDSEGCLKRSDSVDHFALQVNSVVPLVVTFQHKRSRSGGKTGTTTVLLRAGHIVKGLVRGIPQDIFKAESRHSFRHFGYRRNDIQFPRNVPTTRHPRGDGYRMYLEELYSNAVCDEGISHFAFKAFAMHNCAYDADVDEPKPETVERRRRQYRKRMASKASDSTDCATAGQFGQIKASLVKGQGSSLSNSGWQHDSLSDGSVPGFILPLPQQAFFRQSKINRELLGVNVDVCKLVKTNRAEFHQEDSLSEWASVQSLHTTMSVPQCSPVTPDQSNQFRIYAQIRQDRTSRNDRSYSPTELHVDSWDHDSVYTETGVHGYVLDPSSVSESDSNLSPWNVSGDTLRRQRKHVGDRSPLGTYNRACIPIPGEHLPKSSAKRHRRVSPDRLEAVSRNLSTLLFESMEDDDATQDIPVSVLDGAEEHLGFVSRLVHDAGDGDTSMTDFNLPDNMDDNGWISLDRRYHFSQRFLGRLEATFDREINSMPFTLQPHTFSLPVRRRDMNGGGDYFAHPLPVPPEEPQAVAPQQIADDPVLDYF